MSDRDRVSIESGPVVDLTKLDHVSVTVAGLDHVSVTVSDLDASIAFYGDVLGLRLHGRGTADAPELSTMTTMADVRLLWAEFDLGKGQVLELLQFLSPAGEPTGTRLCDPGAGHVGLAVNDVVGARDRLLAAGARVLSDPVRIEEPGDWYGAKTLYALDPDGTWIELVERPG
jgi:catechol 2,3-dioxygenase-like lactoylglutathione lyase family enzyme